MRAWLAPPRMRTGTTPAGRGSRTSTWLAPCPSSRASRRRFRRSASRCATPPRTVMCQAMSWLRWVTQAPGASAAASPAHKEHDHQDLGRTRLAAARRARSADRSFGHGVWRRRTASAVGSSSATLSNHGSNELAAHRPHPTLRTLQVRTTCMAVLCAVSFSMAGPTPGRSLAPQRASPRRVRLDCAATSGVGSASSGGKVEGSRALQAA